MTYIKLKNGQYFDPERQVFRNSRPVWFGKTVMTSDGLYQMYEFEEIKELQEGERGVLKAYCVGIEKRKNTIYANFFDFETISIGKRKFNGEWIPINHDFIPETCYLLRFVIDNNYPDRIKILAKLKVNL